MAQHLGHFLESSHFSRKGGTATEALLVYDLCDLVQDAGAESVWARVGSCVSEEPCRQYIYILPCDMYV